MDERYTVGFFTNSVSPLTDEAIRVAPSRSPQQLTSILEGLAVAGPLSRDPMPEFLAKQARYIPMGATIVLVSGILNQELADAMHNLQRQGYAPSLVWVADTPPPPLLHESITVHSIGPEMARLEAESPFRPPERRQSVAAGQDGD
jgi:hypothetical protein